MANGILYSTLKLNLENGITYEDIIYFTDELFGNTLVELFNVQDWDKLLELNQRKTASQCLKWIKQESSSLVWKNRIWDLECPELSYDELEHLIKIGEIKSNEELMDFDMNVIKCGYSFEFDDWETPKSDSFHHFTVFDLIDKYFPCNCLNGEDCTNCCNCG